MSAAKEGLPPASSPSSSYTAFSSSIHPRVRSSMSGMYWNTSQVLFASTLLLEPELLPLMRLSSNPVSFMSPITSSRRW